MFTHSAVSSLSHNFSREDLFLAVYCLVDDWMHQHYGASNYRPDADAPPRPRSSPTAKSSTWSWWGSCARSNANAPGCVRGASYGKLFPRLPEDSRSTALSELVRQLRASLLCWAGESVQLLRIVDSFPMPRSGMDRRQGFCQSSAQAGCKECAGIDFVDP